MATFEVANIVQGLVKYQFRDRTFIPVVLALTERGDHGRHAQLVRMGMVLIQFFLVFTGYHDEKNSDNSTRFGDSEHCALIAKRCQLDNYMEISDYETQPERILAHGIYALLAAIFLDSKDLNQVVRAMLELGFFNYEEYGVNPRLFSTGLPMYQTDANPPPGTPVHHHGYSLGGPLAYGAMHTDGMATPWSQVPGVGAEGSGFAEFFNLGPFSPSGIVQETVNPPEIVGAEIEAGVAMLAFPGMTNNNEEYPESANGLNQNSADVIRHRQRTAETPGASGNQGTGSDGLDASVSNSLAEEKQRCIAYGERPPDETFFTTMIRRRVRSLDNAHAKTLFLIQLTTANCHVISAIHDMIFSSRQQKETQSLRITAETTAAMLFDQIEYLDTTMSLDMLRCRYRVFYLYKACIVEAPRARGNFILENFGGAARPRGPGNPNHTAKAQVTDLMMREIFPNLDANDKGYQRKRKRVLSLQKLGRRYFEFVERFGEGFLSLLSVNGELGVRDHHVNAVPDSVFDRFLKILDDSQGPMLRDFGTAAFQLLRPLIRGESSFLGRSSAWETHAEEIREYPKGSRKLLETLLWEY